MAYVCKHHTKDENLTPQIRDITRYHSTFEKYLCSIIDCRINKLCLLIYVILS